MQHAKLQSGRKSGVAILVISPTRELAYQIEAEAKELALAHKLSTQASIPSSPSIYHIIHLFIYCFCKQFHCLLHVSLSLDLFLTSHVTDLGLQKSLQYWPFFAAVCGGRNKREFRQIKD